MPAQPAWLLRLPAIRQTLAQLPAPVFDRAVIEEAFGVRRRRAIELMHCFGGYQAGKTFLVDRTSLLGQLESLEQGGDFRQERARRKRLSENLQQAQAVLRARAVLIPAPSAPALELPASVSLQPGQLHIDFRGAEDLLRQLLDLATAIQNDYPRFEKLCAG